MTELLSVLEASKILKVSRQRVWALIKMRKLKAKKVVGRYVISRNELNKFINQRKNNGGIQNGKR